MHSQLTTPRCVNRRSRARRATRPWRVGAGRSSCSSRRRFLEPVRLQSRCCWRGSSPGQEPAEQGRVRSGSGALAPRRSPCRHRRRPSPRWNASERRPWSPRPRPRVRMRWDWVDGERELPRALRLPQFPRRPRRVRGSRASHGRGVGGRRGRERGRRRAGRTRRSKSRPPGTAVEGGGGQAEAPAPLGSVCVCNGREDTRQ